MNVFQTQFYESLSKRRQQQLTKWLQFYQIDSLKCQEAFSVDLITHICYVWLNFHPRTRNILVYLSFQNIKYSFDCGSLMWRTTDLKYLAFVFTKHFSSCKCLCIWGYSSLRCKFNLNIWGNLWYTENRKKSLHFLEISLSIVFPGCCHTNF